MTPPDAMEPEGAVTVMQALGPFVAVVVVAWLLIRRSDTRDHDADQRLDDMRSEYREQRDELVRLLDSEREARQAGELDCARRIGELTGRILELERSHHTATGGT